MNHSSRRACGTADVRFDRRSEMDEKEKLR